MFLLVRRGSCVTLQGPEGRYSVYNPKRIFTGMGWDAQSASALLIGSVPRSALLLGYGGGTVARQLRLMFPEIRLTGVEIDADIIDLAVKHFSSAEVGTTIVRGCGEQFVRESRGSYDFVLDDMWDHNRRRLRAIASDPRWPKQVARCLTRRGVYAANIYARRWRQSEYEFALGCMQRVFATVTELRLRQERVCVLAGSVKLVCPDRIAALASRLEPVVQRHIAALDVTRC